MFSSPTFFARALLLSGLLFLAGCDRKPELIVEIPAGVPTQPATGGSEVAGTSPANGIHELPEIRGRVQDAAYSQKLDKMVVVADDVWIVDADMRLKAIETAGKACSVSIHEDRAAISYTGGVALLDLAKARIKDDFSMSDKGCGEVALGASTLFLNFRQYQVSELVQLDSTGFEVARQRVNSGLSVIAVRPGSWGSDLYGLTRTSSANLVHFITGFDGVLKESFEIHSDQKFLPGRQFWFSTDGEFIFSGFGPVFHANDRLPSRKYTIHSQLEPGDDLSYSDNSVPGDGVASLCHAVRLIAAIPGPRYHVRPGDADKYWNRVRFFRYPYLEDLGEESFPIFRIDDEVPIRSFGRFVFCRNDGKGVFVLLEDGVKENPAWGVLSLSVPKS